MRNIAAIVALSTSFFALPAIAEVSAGKDLVSVFMDVCLLTRGNQTWATQSAARLGLEPIQTTKYDLYKLGKRFADPILLGTAAGNPPYVVRLARSEESERFDFFCEVTNPTLDAENAQTAYIYLPALANLGEVMMVGRVGAIWQSPEWAEGSTVSYDASPYPKLGASIRFHSVVNKP